MTIYIVCPKELEDKCRRAYRASKDGEILGGGVEYTDLSGAVYLSWGSSRVTPDEARALTKAINGVEFYRDEMPMAYFMKVAIEEV